MLPVACTGLMLPVRKITLDSYGEFDRSFTVRALPEFDARVAVPE